MRKMPKATHAVTAIPAPSSVLAACRLIFCQEPRQAHQGCFPAAGRWLPLPEPGQGTRAEIPAACGATGAGDGAASVTDHLCGHDGHGVLHLASGFADLASLALRRAFERLEPGAPSVSVHNVVPLLSLQRDIERDAACQDAGSAVRWQATLSEVLWLARRHLGDGWKPFAADLRASATLQSMWGAPRRPG